LADLLTGPVLDAAPRLLDGLLAHEGPDGRVAVRLTEVEAYDGDQDPGSHAYRGRTDRNAVMFGGPGHLYVYFTYGMHFCCNVVCGEAGRASAVLLRAGEVVDGLELARARRTNGPDRDLARGPARLCQALGIDRSLDGADVCATGSPLRVRAEAGNPARSVVLGPGDDPPEPLRKIVTGPRVGVSSAAEIPWRFWYEGDPTVSVYRAHVPRRPKLVTP
jgi:DNA-3-methyladenine glycosylase